MSLANFERRIDRLFPVLLLLLAVSVGVATTVLGLA